MPLPEIPYDEWFHKPHPHDSMPIAKDEPLDLAPSSVEPQDESENIHEKMYEIATAKYNPFAVGGSESIHDFGGNS